MSPPRGAVNPVKAAFLQRQHEPCAAPVPAPPRPGPAHRPRRLDARGGGSLGALSSVSLPPRAAIRAAAARARYGPRRERLLDALRSPAAKSVVAREIKTPHRVKRRHADF